MNYAVRGSDRCHWHCNLPKRNMSQINHIIGEMKVVNATKDENERLQRENNILRQNIGILVKELAALTGEKQTLDETNKALVEANRILVEEKHALADANQSLTEANQELIEANQALVEENQVVSEERDVVSRRAFHAEYNLSLLHRNLEILSEESQRYEATQYGEEAPVYDEI